jgi:hypothetical protein
VDLARFAKNAFAFDNKHSVAWRLGAIAFLFAFFAVASHLSTEQLGLVAVVALVLEVVLRRKAREPNRL